METFQISKLFILIILFRECFAQLEHPKDTKISLEERLSDCILVIYNEYFPKHLPVILQTTNMWYQMFKPILKKHTTDKDGDLLLKKLNENYILQVTIGYREDFKSDILSNKTTSKLKIGSYILILSGKDLSENLNILAYMVTQIYKALLNPSSRLVLATTWVPKTIHEKKLFQTAAMNHIWDVCEIPDAILVLPMKGCSTGAFEILQWMPKGQTAECIDPVRKINLIDRWFCPNNTFQFGQDLFPVKRIEDVRHCTIKLRFGYHWPYLYSHDGRQLIGTFPSIIREALKGTPFDATFVRHPVSEGMYFPFYLEPRDFLDECSVPYPYFVDEVLWCVPSPKQLPRWKSLIRPFDTSLWLFVVATLIFGIATFWFILKVRYPNQNQCLTKIIFDTFSTQLLGGMPDAYKGSTVTLFFVLWIFYSLLIGTAYQSALFAFVMNPGYYEPIKNFDSLKRVSNFRRMAEGKEGYEDVQAIALVDYVKLSNEGQTMALLTTKATFELLLAVYGRVTILPVSTAHLYVTSLLLRTKCRCMLYEYLDKVIRRFVNFGIANLFYRSHVTETLAKLAVELDFSAIPLLMWHLQGAFYLCVLGTLISFLVFVGEHLKYRYKKSFSC